MLTVFMFCKLMSNFTKNIRPFSHEVKEDVLTGVWLLFLSIVDLAETDNHIYEIWLITNNQPIVLQILKTKL